MKVLATGTQYTTVIACWPPTAPATKSSMALELGIMSHVLWRHGSQVSPSIVLLHQPRDNRVLPAHLHYLVVGLPVHILSIWINTQWYTGHKSDITLVYAVKVWIGNDNSRLSFSHRNPMGNGNGHGVVLEREWEWALLHGNGTEWQWNTHWTFR